MATSEGPQAIGFAVAEVMNRRMSEPPRPQPSAEDIAARRQQWINGKWSGIVHKIGERYRDCSLENFELSADESAAARQREAIGALKRFVAKPEKGTNVVLFGPPGTGKDHCLAAMMRVALETGTEIEWVDGSDLFSQMRDLIDSDRSEYSFLQQWSKAAVLVISDPLPPFGALSAFQAATLFRIVDRRYRECKPTWVSMNVSSSREASERIGEQVVDRLKDGAIALHFDWPSYRKPKARP